MFTDKDWIPATREELGWGELPKPQTDDQPSNVTITNSKGEVIDDIEEYIKPPLTAGEFAGKMIGAGVDQVQGLGYGAVGLAGDLAEVEGVKNWGLEGFNENMRAAALANKEAGMGEFSDIEGVGDAAKWAYGTFLQQVPQLLPTLALGGAGGLAGKQLAKGFITSAMQKGIATGLTEEAAAATVANAVASRGGMKWAARRLMEGGFTREAAEGSLGQIAKAQMAPVAGAAAGNLATGIGMEAGSIYGETEDAGLALQYGIPAGMIEGLTDSIIGAPFVKRAFGVNAVKSVAKEEEASLLKDLGKGVAKGLAVEGPLEELPQTYLEQLANLEKDPNHYGPGGIDSEMAKRERMNAMAAGSLIGSAIGGAGGVVEHLAPMTASALIQRRLTDPETGQTDPETGTEEKIPSGELLYDNDSVDIDGVTMRRWNIEKTGDSGWAVENAPQETLDKLAAAKSGVVSNGKLLIFPNNEEGATLIDRAETARAKSLGEIDDKDGDGIPDKEQADKTLTPLKLRGLPVEGAEYGKEVGLYDVFSNVTREVGSTAVLPPSKIKPAPEALGKRVQYEGYEGVLSNNGARYQLFVDKDTVVDLPADAEVEVGVPLPAPRGDTALTTAVTPADRDIVKDFGIAKAEPPKEEVPLEQQQGIDAIGEISKAVLDRDEVGILDSVEEVSKVEPLDENAVAILGDAQRSLEDAITGIEARNLPMAAKEAATAPLYDKLVQIDRIHGVAITEAPVATPVEATPVEAAPVEAAPVEAAPVEAAPVEATPVEATPVEAAPVEATPAREPNPFLSEEARNDRAPEAPASPVEVKLQEMQAAHDKSEAEKKDERQKLLDSRTPEQDQTFLEGLKAGDKITNGVTSGTFVKGTEDGGVVVATKKGKKKISSSTVSNITYDNSSPAPTRDAALVEKLGSVDAPNLEAAGLKVTGDVDDDGVEILENPRKDIIVKGTPFKVFTQLFTNAAGEVVPRSWHEYAPNTATTATRKTAKRDVLRAMDQGVEVRIPNSVEVPAGVSVVPVEGKNYSVVDAVDYEEDGVNIGTYTAADLAERQGTFKDDYNGSRELNNLRLQRSIANNRSREANETSADASAADAASNLPPAAQAIFSLFNGTWLKSADAYLGSDKMSGVGPDGIEHFNKTAANKFIKALSTAFGKEDGDADLVKKTAELFASGEKVSKIPKLALEGRAQNKKETALVNRTIKKLDGNFKFFVLPQKHATPLGQVASAAFTFDKLRRKLSLDAKNEGGESLGDSLSQDGGKAKGVSLSEASAPYNVQQGEEDAETTQDSVSRGELTDEEMQKIAKQKERTSEIASSQGIEAALATLTDSLSETEQLAYDYLSSKGSKVEIYRKLEEQLERLGDETSPDEVIADVRSQIAEVAQRVAGKKIILSPAATAGAAAPVGLNGGKVERKKSSPQVQRIKRRFLQVKGGLSDDQMVSMEDAEVDRAYLSYTAKADETRAASAQDAVVSVSPGIERLVSLDSKSLVGEYADAITAAEAGDSSDLRDLNFKELVRMGAYHSTKEFLTRIADPKNGASRDMQIRAKAFLGLEKRGMNLANIEAQAASFTKAGTKERAAWAGLLGRNADSTAFGIYLNLDQAHDRATPVQTFLHELAHVTTIAKINGAVKTTAEEDRIIKDLERMRRAAVIKAGDASPVIKAAADAAGVSTPEQRYESYIKTFSKLIAQGAEGSRKYNGLQNLNEFVVEMTGSPDFVKLLSQLGFGTANPEKRAFTGMIRDALNSILKLIAGNISPSSEIGKAFSDSWKLTYSGSKYKVEPSALLESVRGVVAEEKAKEETKAKPKAEPKAKVEKATEPTVKESLPVETPDGNNPATEKKPEGPKRGRGRPKVPRVQTELPTKEAFEKEMAQGEMTPEERAAEFAKEKEPLAPQSPAGTRKTPASPFAEGEREMAEVRATNHSAVLFYAGINEEAFYSAVGKGDFTADELEQEISNAAPVSTMLSNIAGDETLSAPLRHVAQMLLDLGHDFSGVKFRVAREGDTDWAGLYTIGNNASSGEIAINVDASHRGGVAQTLVHEALHHVSFFKLKPGYQLNKVERAAVRDLEKLRKHAERVYRGKNLAEGKSSSSRASTNEGYYGLTNIDEFLTEILSDESFQAFLVGIKPMNGIAKKGGLIRNLLDQVFSYLKDFVFGTDVSGDSLLTQGLDNVMTLIQTPQDDLMVQAMASVMDERKSMPSAPTGASVNQEVTEEVEAINSLPDDATFEQIQAVAPATIINLKATSKYVSGSFSEFKKIILNSFKSLQRFSENIWRGIGAVLTGITGLSIALGPIIVVDYNALSGPEARSDLRETGLLETTNLFKPYIRDISVEQLDKSLQTPEETLKLIKDAIKQSKPFSGKIDFDFSQLSKFAGIDVSDIPTGNERESFNYNNLIETSNDEIKSAAEFLNSASLRPQEIESRVREIMGAMEFFTKRNFKGVRFKIKDEHLGQPETRRHKNALGSAVFVALARNGGMVSSLSFYDPKTNTINVDPQTLISILDNTSAATNAAEHIANELTHALQYQTNDGKPIGLLSIKLSDYDTAATALWMRTDMYAKHGKEFQFINAESNWGSLLVKKYFNATHNIQPKSFAQITNDQPKIKQALESKQTEAFIKEVFSYGGISAQEIIEAKAGATPEGEMVMSPAGDMATKVLKLTGAEEHTTFNNGIYKTGGWLSADGKLDQRAGDKWRDSRHKIAATTRRIDTLSSRLVKAVKASKGATTALMNTALGNLDNPLTQKQREEVKQMRVSDESGANAMEAAFIAKNREAYRVKQRAALAALPKNVAEAISEMTEHISELSSTLKAAGFLDPKIAATVDANLGIYLHRSYQIFDDEKYAAEVRKNTKVMQAAEGLVKRQVESRNAAELIRQIEDEGGFISKADAVERTRGSAKKEDIDKAMDSLLSIGEEGMGAVILRGRIPGQKDMSIFDARGNIAPEIQALWGRYEDPTINYAKSVMKMATLTANHQFLSDIRSMGLKDGWLYEGPETARPRGYLKISSDNNKSLAPLAGLHGNRLLVEALYGMFPQNGVSDNYAWVRAFSKATGWAMAAKTVLSPVAQVRNNLGNILFDVAAGNFGFSDISKIKGRASTAFNMSFKAAFNKFPEDAAFRKEMMSSLEDLVSRGVIGESLVGNILGDLMGAKKLSKSADEFSDRLMGGASRAASGVWNTAQRSYASSDDFWKVMGYLAEVDKYTKAMPGWTSGQVKDHAARIVRDIRPTYSLSPAVLAKVKAFPFVAPFITFTTEVIRTTINLTKLAHYEITEGNRTGNAELTKIGWKRARGITLAATAPTAAAGVFTALAGISGDDEDRLRRFLPDWQKNSQLLLFKNKDGKVSFADISYLDPYDYWKKAAGALFRALASSDDATATERITKGTMEAVGQLMRPFTSEQLVSGAIADVLRNTDSSGRQVFNPQDTGTNIAEKTVLHILKAFRPGALDVTSRIWSAAAGDVSDSGRAYNLGNEIAGLALGQRITEVNIEQALGFKASKFSRDDRDASAIFTKEFNSKGTRSTEQIADAYERANDAKYKLTSDFRDDLNAAIALGGISQKKAVEILKAYRVGQDDIQMIRSGRYKPYEPSDAAIKLAPKDRVKTAKAAAKLATSKPL